MRGIIRSAAWLTATIIVTGALDFALQAQATQAPGTWGTLGTTPDARTDAASVTLRDGRTLIIGGRTLDGNATGSVLMLDPQTGVIADAGELADPRVNHTATLLLDGRVLVAGGDVAGSSSATLEMFDPTTGSSMPAGSLLQARVRHAATRLPDGTVLLIGGTGADGLALDSAEIFTPATGVATPVAELMTTPRSGASATTLIDGRVLIVGGSVGGTELASAEIYDRFSSPLFSVADSTLSVARSGHTAVLLPHNNSVLIAGGTSMHAPVNASDLFVPAEFPDPYSWGLGRFAATGDMSAARSSAVGGPAGDDGHAFVLGGGVDSVEAYRYATIKTDKDDYAPGENAIITGSGWEPNSTVTLVFQEDPAVHEDYRLTVDTDSEGNFDYRDWAPEHHDIGVRFYLTAKDGRSHAQITFTDAPKVGSVTVSAQSPTTVSGGNSATYQITVNRGAGGGSSGAFTANLGITSALPAGVTASFSPSMVSFTASATSRTSTLTLTTTAGTPAGNTAFGVRAATSTQDYAEGTGTLVVEAATIGTSTQVNLSHGSAPYGTAVTATATVKNVSNANPVTTGSVTFVEGGTCAVPAVTHASAVPLNASGQASFTSSTMSVAGSPHQLIACFNNELPYLASEGTAALTITPKPITIVPGSGLSKVFAAVDPVLAYTANPALESSDSFTGALSRATGENVGSYAIALGTLTAGSNYTLSLAPATFAITAKPIVVTPDAGQNKVYGAADPVLTYAASPALQSGDGFSGGLARAAGEDVGAYAITIGSLSAGSNYSLTLSSAPVTFAITARAIGVVADAKTKAYGDADPSLTYRINSGSLKDGDAFIGGLTRDPGEDVGSYAIKQGSLALSSNYELTFTGAALLISKRPVTVTADPKSKVYGELDPTLTYQITSGSLKSGDGFTGSLARDNGENVGSYAIRQGSLALSGNYELAFTGSSLTIGKASAFVTADNKSRTYGAPNPDLTAEVTGTVNGDVLQYSLSTVATQFSAVGSYPIAVTLGSNPNYEVTPTGAALTVSAKQASVVANAKSKTYGDENPELDAEVTGTVNGDVLQYSLSTAATQFSPVGSYPIDVTPGSNPNYEVSTAGAALIVSARTLTGSFTANDKTYDGTTTATVKTTALEGLVGEDSVELVVTTPSFDSKNVGSAKPVTGGLSLTGLLAGNYSVNPSHVALASISTRALEITATAADKVYDGGTAATATLSDDRVSGDSFSVSHSAAHFADKNVGSGKLVSVTGIAIVGGDSGNYSHNTTAVASAAIGARSLTVSAAGVDKVYDGTTSATVVLSDNRIAGDALSTGWANAAFASKNVGTHAVSVTGIVVTGTDVMNYTFQTSAATMATITPRQVTIKADPKAKVFGAADPVLTYQLVEGSFVAGDGLSGGLTRDGAGTAGGELVGSYTIRQGSVVASSNYDVVFVTDVLTITAWSTSGFHQPVGTANSTSGAPAVAASTVWNTVKGGSTVPLKFNLHASAGGTELTSVADVSSIVALKVVCTAGLEDAVDQVLASAGTNLRYDTVDRHFIQNWQTPKSAGSCYRVTMTARDGSQISAFFKLK